MSTDARNVPINELSPFERLNLMGIVIKQQKDAALRRHDLFTREKKLRQDQYDRAQNPVLKGYRSKRLTDMNNWQGELAQQLFNLEYFENEVEAIKKGLGL